MIGVNVIVFYTLTRNNNLEACHVIDYFHSHKALNVSDEQDPAEQGYHGSSGSPQSSSGKTTS